jgi:hypothetical protein
MTQLAIPRHPAGPNAVDRHRQPASTTQSGSGSAPVWTRRDAPMTDASDIGLRRAAPGTGGLAARPVSVPGSSPGLRARQFAPAGAHGTRRTAESDEPDRHARSELRGTPIRGRRFAEGLASAPRAAETRRHSGGDVVQAAAPGVERHQPQRRGARKRSAQTCPAALKRLRSFRAPRQARPGPAAATLLRWPRGACRSARSPCRS